MPSVISVFFSLLIYCLAHEPLSNLLSLGELFMKLSTLLRIQRLGRIDGFVSSVRLGKRGVGVGVCVMSMVVVIVD